RLSAMELAGRVRRGEVTAREVTAAVLERIAAVDCRIRAFLTVLIPGALDDAERIDSAIRAGIDPGPLAGVPIGLKDNICTRGVRTTAGSALLTDYIPPYNATVVAKLRRAGSVVIGKTNCDEFAMGSSTENSAFQATTNPWDVTRVPGGSSGGSAAAVAALEGPIALGSDTGGSIRQPASLCGVVGLKPTYGLVSRSGLISYASSLDQIGPFARSVRDAALVLNVIAGHDPADSTSVARSVPDYCAACSGDVRGVRIGAPREYLQAGVDSDVRASILSAIEDLTSLGAVVEECSLPMTDYALAAYYILAPAEASSNLARYDGVRYGARTTVTGSHIDMMDQTRGAGFGPEVKQRIMIGTYALSAGYYDEYYLRAQRVRTLLRREFDAAFQKYSALITPTSPTTAFRLGERSDPLAMKLADVCTLPVNMAGLPAISVPCGLVNGLPVGLQLIARPFDEPFLLKLAYNYEQATNWRLLQPAVSGQDQ
ncbi:MAG TPA: Asp-tRNA(Asn)/Glu-tRNA(Gln) amidotransferase subunit GatA, partial [Chthonomonadales bacterium]|nr:Asp-tRNA(Asn)/Glu-tRNA(Gln) amidotransferase subunit GatA [Chthonomonadales bacterium]